MKIIRNITVDAEVWAKAQQKTDSVSGTIDFLLRRWIETEAEDFERNKIQTYKLQVDEMKAKLASMQKQVLDMKKKDEANRPVRIIE